MARWWENFAKRIGGGGTKTPIGIGVIARATNTAVDQTVAGNDPSNWMSPHQPLKPQQQGVAGRQFDFRVGSNLQYTPRGDESVTFSQMRDLADAYDLLRLIIETRKDQLVKFKWSIGPIDEEVDPDGRSEEMTKFFKFPDKRHNWQTWLRSLVEEMLVTDAACLYPIRTRGGDLNALELMDGTTLKIVIDSSGRQPLPPGVAYQQVLKGIPAVDYSADDVVYAPRNRRVSRLYGYSPVEQVIMTVNIGLRRQLSQLQSYTEGNVPEALLSVPPSWSSNQIAEYQAYWDDMMEGDTAARRHAKFVPDGMKYWATKTEILKDPFDEWLARVICFAFSIPSSPFVKDMNRATSESAKEAAAEEGLQPLMIWIKDLIDSTLWKYKGYTDLEFKWQDEAATDPNEQSQIEDRRLRNGTLSIDEVRADLGLDAIGMPNAIYTGQGATLVKDVINPPEPVAPPPAFGNKPPPQSKGSDESRSKKTTQADAPA